MEGRNSDTPCRVRCIVASPCFQGLVDGSADRSKQWVHADRRLDRKPVKEMVVVEVDRVSDSCGYGVPVMQVVGPRDLLRPGADKRGPEGLAAYRRDKNARSLDGLPALDPPPAAPTP